MYSIEPIERGEQFRYTKGDLCLVLERTYCKGHRIFTQSIANLEPEHPLTFDERAAIVRDLCEFFEVKRNKTIFVVWETDPHRAELQALLGALQEEGHLIAIELDSTAKRQAAQDRQNLEFLRDGWSVTIEGRKFTSVESYENWMRDREEEL